MAALLDFVVPAELPGIECAGFFYKNFDFVFRREKLSLINQVAKQVAEKPAVNFVLA